MITILVNGKVYRQVEYVHPRLVQWMRFAREDPREVQVWQTLSKRSVRYL